MIVYSGTSGSGVTEPATSYVTAIDLILLVPFAVKTILFSDPIHVPVAPDVV